ncbi:MAG TPA: DUF6588 family protein [Fibrobacteria bacterium]|jgi:hypothetical protein|nr:DUF6588 family protein [Fibrobacteria bacterium]
MRTFYKGLIITGLAVSAAMTQTMEETVSKLGAAAGKAYVAPVVSGFGSNLNAGWFHKSPPAKKFGLNFEVGPVFMGTLLKGGSKTLNVSGGFRLDSTQARNVANEVDTTGMFGQGQALRDSVAAAIRRSDIRVNFAGPTIIGEDGMPMTYEVAADPITVGTMAGDTTITLPSTVDTLRDGSGAALNFAVLSDFADMPLPLVAPQITIGTIYGTNLTVRYLPEYDLKDVGTIKFSGFGIQHNPAVWLGSPLPVDLSVGFFTQSLEVGTLFKASSQAYGLNVSKTFGWRILNVTPYGGFMFENSNFDFKYDLELDDGEAVPISFSLEGENKYRATAGLSVRLFLINLNADYNFAKYNSFSAGVMVGI